MRMISLFTIILTFGIGWTEPLKQLREAYSWVYFEPVKRDSMGLVNVTPTWGRPYQMKSSVDTFVIFENYDSIRMISPGGPAQHMFIKVKILSDKWNPRPKYGNKLFFLGTYERVDLRENNPGMYFSFYATKDWSTLMQVHYRKPGEMIAALLFSQKKINILQKQGLIVDPKDD